MKSCFNNRRPMLMLWFGIVACLSVSLADACNVPVFRYALEHWRPDAFQGVLFHRGPLTAAEQQRLSDLQDGSANAVANLAIRTVDLDGAVDAVDRDLLSVGHETELPRLVVRYPATLRVERPVWSGRFDDPELAGLLDSPVRQEILRRLTTGQTAVWVLIDSGDTAQDEPAAATLAAELDHLKQTLKLPELTDSPEDAIQDGPALRVGFSLLRVRRDDPSETALVAMLLGCEPDLSTLNEPIVFPMFGRSRAMLPLVGAGISQENIRGSAKFLAGACSCQVKELNPGFDLLIKADWNRLLSWVNSPTAATEESSSVAAKAELVPIPSGSKIDSNPPQVAAEKQLPAEPARGSSRNLTLIIVIGVAAVLFVAFRPKRA